MLLSAFPALPSPEAPGPGRTPRVPTGCSRSCDLPQRAACFPEVEEQAGTTHVCPLISQALPCWGFMQRQTRKAPFVPSSWATVLEKPGQFFTVRAPHVLVSPVGGFSRCPASPHLLPREPSSAGTLFRGDPLPRRRSASATLGPQSFQTVKYSVIFLFLNAGNCIFSCCF